MSGKIKTITFARTKLRAVRQRFLKSSMIDFFVLGAVKAGTTSLHKYLMQHPMIEMSRQKWTRFFHIDAGDPDFEKLAQRYGPLLLNESLVRFKRICNVKVPRDFETYLRQWDYSKPGMIRGEISPTYMYDLKACHQIRKRFPNAKIIIILREPVQRAISHFTMDRAYNWVLDRDFLTAIRREPWQVNEFWWGARHYLRHGLYSRYLQPIYSIFDSKNIKLILYDDMSKSTSSFLDEVTDFLGVDKLKFDVSERHNVATREKPELSADVLDSLGKFFRQDIEKVQSMTGLDFEFWFQNKIKVS